MAGALKYPKTYRPDRHPLLWRRQDEFAERAGILPEAIWARLSAREFEEAEIDWFRDYRVHKFSPVRGLLYVGLPPGLTVPERMQRLTGAFLRNFVDAKFRTLSHALSEYRDGSLSASVLLVPDFCLKVVKPRGPDIADFNGLMIARFTQRQQTVLYADSFELIEQRFGAMLASTIEKTFIRIESTKK